MMRAPSLPISAALSLSRYSFLRARPIARELRPTTSAFRPSIAKSPVPLPVQTSGRPHAAASAHVLLHPALCSADANTSADAYMAAWKLGLKAVALYRDGSKRTQPLSTRKGGQAAGADTAASGNGAGRPYRRRLPDERQAITHKFSIGGHEGYVTVGMYEDGTPGEIFVVMSKQGSVVSGLMDGFATTISMALQYGVPLNVLVDKFSHTRFEPSGFTNNPEIPIAKSILDYIFRWLASRFLSEEDQDRVGVHRRTATPVVEETEETGTDPEPPAAQEEEAEGNGNGGLDAPSAFAFRLQEDAPPCHECGSIMVRSGSCYKCLNCGATSGCS